MPVRPWVDIMIMVEGWSSENLTISSTGSPMRLSFDTDQPSAASSSLMRWACGLQSSPGLPSTHNRVMLVSDFGVIDLT